MRHSLRPFGAPPSSEGGLTVWFYQLPVQNRRGIISINWLPQMRELAPLATEGGILGSNHFVDNQTYSFKILDDFKVRKT